MTINPTVRRHGIRVIMALGIVSGVFLFGIASKVILDLFYAPSPVTAEVMQNHQTSTDTPATTDSTNLNLTTADMAATAEALPTEKPSPLESTQEVKEGYYCSADQKALQYFADGDLKWNRPCSCSLSGPGLPDRCTGQPLPDPANGKVWQGASGYIWGGVVLRHALISKGPDSNMKVTNAVETKCGVHINPLGTDDTEEPCPPPTPVPPTPTTPEGAAIYWELFPEHGCPGDSAAAMMFAWGIDSANLVWDGQQVPFTGPLMAFAPIKFTTADPLKVSFVVKFKDGQTASFDKGLYLKPNCNPQPTPTPVGSTPTATQAGPPTATLTTAPPTPTTGGSTLTATPGTPPTVGPPTPTSTTSGSTATATPGTPPTVGPPTATPLPTNTQVVPPSVTPTATNTPYVPPTATNTQVVPPTTTTAPPTVTPTSGPDCHDPIHAADGQWIPSDEGVMFVSVPDGYVGIAVGWQLKRDPYYGAGCRMAILAPGTHVLEVREARVVIYKINSCYPNKEIQDLRDAEIKTQVANHGCSAMAYTNVPTWKGELPIPTVAKVTVGDLVCHNTPTGKGKSLRFVAGDIVTGYRLMLDSGAVKSDCTLNPAKEGGIVLDGVICPDPMEMRPVCK